MDIKRRAAILLKNLVYVVYSLSLNEEAYLSKLEKPKEKQFGDVAFPCFTLSKELKSSAKDIAKKLEEKAETLNLLDNIFEKVEAVGGYLNFYLDTSKAAKALFQEIASGIFFQSPLKQQKKIMVEYGQVNTHKVFHVGHIRNAVLGDTTARLLNWLGNNVVRVNYPGDEGTHVATCLWYLKNHYQGEIPKKNRVEFLGNLYTKAVLMLDPSQYSYVPYTEVVSAKIKEIKKIEQDIFQVKLTAGKKNYTTVATDTAKLLVGSVVAFAPAGTKLAKRQIKERTVKGVKSQGIIATFEDLNLDPNLVSASLQKNDYIILPDSVPLGESLTNLFPKKEKVYFKEKITTQIKKWREEIGDFLKRLEDQETEARKLWIKTRAWCLEELDEIFNWLNCSFHCYFFESEFSKPAKELAFKFLEKKVFTSSDGAIGADLSEENLGFCILIKSDGTATYAGRDLALAILKLEKFNLDKSIYVVDSAQELHFKQVFSCLKKIGIASEKCFHLSYQHVVLKEGKMSSRKGNIIPYKELRESLYKKIKEEFLNKYIGEWSNEEIEEAANIIALAVIRYGMLNQENKSPVVFDLNEWTSKTGNTGSYLLYTVARISSIFRQIPDKNWQKKPPSTSLLLDPCEKEVIRHLVVYPEALTASALSFSPHLLCTYLFQLAKLFNTMYQSCSVINAESSELMIARAFLVKSVQDVLTHGLSLLGIKTLERM